MDDAKSIPNDDFASFCHNIFHDFVFFGTKMQYYIISLNRNALVFSVGLTKFEYTNMMGLLYRYRIPDNRRTLSRRSIPFNIWKPTK